MVGKKGAVLSTQTYGAAATWLLLEAVPVCGGELSSFLRGRFPGWFWKMAG